MKLIYFLPDIEAGVCTIVRAMIKYSPNVPGIEHTVVLYRAEDDHYKQVVDDFGNATVHRITYYHDDNVYTVFRKMQQLIKSDKDIIVSNDGLELRMVTGLKLKNPVTYIIHGDYNYYYKLIELNHYIIDTIITYSSCIHEKVIAMLPGKKDSIKKIYYPAAFVNEISNEYTKPGGFNILFAGMLFERKGAHLLKNIYDACINFGMTDFDLTIIGNGDFYDSIKNDFADNACVKVMGWQPSEVVYKEMKNAHVFLFPSNAEGLPNVVVEALSCGAVPVATNLESGITDIITDRINGILVESQDSTLFAEALLYLYQNRDVLQKLSDSGKEGLQKFEPFTQALLYHNAIVDSLGFCEKTKRVYPTYSMGRVLNKKWLPNWVVKITRKIIKHPQL